MSEADTLLQILTDYHTIAVVGLSPHPNRPSHYVARYMQQHGYRIVPVNPAHDRLLGERCYPDLAAIPVPIDIVNCLRKSDQIPALAEQAVAIRAKVLWMQLGIAHPQAAQIARQGGLTVVEDRCLKIEYARLFD